MPSVMLLIWHNGVRQRFVILHAIEPIPGSVVRRFGTVGREAEEQGQKGDG